MGVGAARLRWIWRWGGQIDWRVDQSPLQSLVSVVEWGISPRLGAQGLIIRVEGVMSWGGRRKEELVRT